MTPKNYLFALLAIIQAFSSIEAALAERPCGDIVGELKQIYVEPLACARKNCPDFRIIYTGSDVDDRCALGCVAKNNGEINVTEQELIRCKDEFKSIDERDFYRIAWCMVGSKSVALVVEPFMLCGRRDKCTGRSVWGSSECLDQCRNEAQQLVEVATTTMERCGGLG